MSIVVSSSSSDSRVCRLLGSTDELWSGGGMIVSESLGSLCGWSASALRFRFADLDLAIAGIVIGEFQGLWDLIIGVFGGEGSPAAETVWAL